MPIDPIMRDVVTIDIADQAECVGTATISAIEQATVKVQKLMQSVERAEKLSCINSPFLPETIPTPTEKVNDRPAVWQQAVCTP